ncbi:hypothetical protein JL720_6000 [Aureococcus anophagefferens]|nr:hypothetical protein JL720_6000 [Aureococcus anophagefferens]
MEDFADDLQSLGPRDGADDGGLDAADEGLPREAIDVDCFDELLNAPLVDSPRNARPPSAAGDEERRLASGEVMPFETVHAWLRKLATGGDAPRTLPLRPSASPFAPFSGPSAASSRAREGRGESGGISVAFQSVTNGEAWWAPDELRGVVRRPMARRVRSGERGRVHGYRGWLYTLTARPDARAPPAADRGADVALVQLWRDGGTGGTRAPPDDEDSSQFCDSLSDAENGATARSGERSSRTPSPRGLRKRRDNLYTEEDVVPRTTRFLRDVVVEGAIRGTIRAPEGAADYAEWFPWHDDVLASPKLPPPGSVVAIDARTQSLTLDTSGDGPVLITSSRPSVAAGVPDDEDRRRRGALVAFVGQVPVRCDAGVRAATRRAVGAGGGAAAAARAAPGAVLGVALGDAGDGPGGFEVLCFVRWHQAVQREVGRELGTWVARCARAGSNGMFWLSLVQIALTLALTLNTTRGAALGRKPPPRPVARPSGVDLGEPRWERVHMFSSVIIGVDHVCLYGLIALYGPTLPRLRLVMAQWVVGLSTLPATWAVWGRVSDDLQYAFAFYFALLPRALLRDARNARARVGRRPEGRDDDEREEDAGEADGRCPEPGGVSVEPRRGGGERAAEQARRGYERERGEQDALRDAEARGLDFVLHSDVDAFWIGDAFAAAARRLGRRLGGSTAILDDFYADSARASSTLTPRAIARLALGRARAGVT